MKSSELTKDLIAALAEASKDFPRIERGCSATVETKKGGRYSYSYSDLDDVLSAVRPQLAKNGLVLSHDCVVLREKVEGEDGWEWEYSVETTAILEHSSGQWKHSTPLLIPCDGSMAAAQLVGSGNTYGKRYTAQNILGLSTESDDDGNGAAGNQATTGKREPLPACPKCETNKSVIVGKAEYGGGFVCYKPKGGCGEKWHLPPNDAAKRLQDEQEAAAVNQSGHPPREDKPETPQTLTADDSKFVDEACASLLACTSDAEVRKLWKAISDSKSPAVKTLVHPTYNKKLKSFAGAV